ncbi:MAG TPA: type II toxin-antitoxin system RelE/ParE family toxin [Sphingomonas sp.]|jgi:plasmid stabilization system protein ParE|nr:type II toxin-antitoxin system RelE/ParE family toxin [Sphingomonas sp.]
MADVIWRRDALNDLDGIIAYIEIDDPAAAIRVRNRLVELGDSLTEFPGRGRPASGGTREMVTVAPYVLVYRLVGDTVNILAISHGRRQRDPVPE